MEDGDWPVVIDKNDSFSKTNIIDNLVFQAICVITIYYLAGPIKVNELNWIEYTKCFVYTNFVLFSIFNIFIQIRLYLLKRKINVVQQLSPKDQNYS